MSQQEADDLRQQIRDLYHRRARGDVAERLFNKLLGEASLALCRAVIAEKLLPGETIGAEHHVVYSHFKLNQSLLADPEQLTASFFATDRRLIRVLGSMQTGRPVSCDDQDHTTIDDLTYQDLRQVNMKRQVRWSEAGTGCAVMLLALLLRSVLAVTGPLLLLLGFAGMLHALLLPTRWLEISAGESKPVFQLHGLRRRGARAIRRILKEALRKARQGT